jgi:Tetracyclin repressor-like, C-terminal domain
MARSTSTAIRRRAGRVIRYDEVVAGARRHFLSRATIDMDSLAADLSVSRSTLYRVVEGRDRLLGDVLWSLGEPVLAQARRDVGRRDVDGILEISRRFYEGIVEAPAFRRFLSAEADTAVRVLFTPNGGVHERYVRAQRDIFAEATRQRAVELGSDLDSLAYLYIRIYESMLYADLLIGRPPDIEPAERAARALLLAG